MLPDKKRESHPGPAGEHPRWDLWILVACCGLAAGILGGIISTTTSASWDKIVAAVASLGSLGAAFATYLTVKEMRAARVLGARARITPKTPSNIIDFTWSLYPDNAPPLSIPFPIVARNASQGAAKNICINWKSITPLPDHVFDRVRDMCGADRSINLAADGYLVEFSINDTIKHRMIVGSSDTVFLGDMGPSQEDRIFLPVTMLNSAFIHWCGLLSQVREGFPVRPEEVPAFELMFTHDSPYEKGIQDRHVVRLHMHEFEFKGPRMRVINWTSGDHWRVLKLVLRLEFSSQEVESVPVVIV